MKKLKYLEIIFENCEMVKIPAKLVSRFSFECNKLDVCSFGIKKEVGKYPVITQGYIEISPKGSLLNYNWIGYNQNLFKRITAYTDITQIYLHFGGKDIEGYYVEWGNEDNDISNSRQQNHVDQDGYLTIHFGELSDDPFFQVEVEENL